MKHTKCYIPEFPRPQLVRKDWKNLNGKWKFAFGEEVSEKDALAGNLPRTINVPFCYECKASGIGIEEQHETVWYATKIDGKKGKHTLLHFEGADYDTQVFVNGVSVGTHRGAYSRFTFDVTPYLTDKDNLLTVCCHDSYHPVQVRGKQRWVPENFGCWYVQTTGIYKTVWLEYVDEVYLTDCKLTPQVTDNSIYIEASVSAPADDVDVEYAITFDGALIKRVRVSCADVVNGVRIRLDSEKSLFQVAYWGLCDDPALYDIDITVYKAGKAVDTAGSYFGLRTVEAKDGKLLMSDVTLYERLVLDQGYWEESGLTPPNEEAIIKDITLCKQMGFNGVRKHQKVEDERYLYYADIMGFAVWCELPSYHFFCDDAIGDVTEQWLNIVRQNYNHPSVITWVIFNESWGVRNIGTNKAQQNLATGLYYLTKSIDPMRPVVSNDGWQHAKTDILTLHNYEQDGDRLYAMYDSLQKQTEGGIGIAMYLPFAEGFRYEGQPIIFSEFGGTAYCRDCEHSAWGYGAGVHSDQEYLERLSSLVHAVEKMHLAGYCYTQITDVQQEVNGLLKPDRTPKVPMKELAKIFG